MTETTNLKRSHTKQWSTIEILRNRLPNWATAAIAILSTLLSICATYGVCGR